MLLLVMLPLSSTLAYAALEDIDLQAGYVGPTIPDGTTTLSLPSYLSGDYEIQIIRGSFKF